MNDFVRRCPPRFVLYLRGGPGGRERRLGTFDTVEAARLHAHERGHAPRDVRVEISPPAVQAPRKKGA